MKEVIENQIKECFKREDNQKHSFQHIYEVPILRPIDIQMNHLEAARSLIINRQLYFLELG